MCIVLKCEKKVKSKVTKHRKNNGEEGNGFVTSVINDHVFDYASENVLNLWRKKSQNLAYR